METSILVARLLGVLYIVAGLSMAMNGKFYKDAMNDMMHSKATMFFGGVASLVVGTLLVNYHNLWESSWVVLVTLIGWIALIKGLMLLLFPSSTKWWVGVLKKIDFTKYGYIAILIGLVFSYFGYFAV